MFFSLPQAFLSLLHPLVVPVDTVETLDVFIRIIIGLITVAGSVIAVAVYLKKSVNKTNSDFISNTKDFLNSFKDQINEKLDASQKSTSKELDTKLQGVTNIIVEKSNAQKDVLSDLKSTVQRFDTKLDQTGQQTVKHETILNEHSRRITNIENAVNKYYNSPVYSANKKINANPYADKPFDSNEIKTDE